MITQPFRLFLLSFSSHPSNEWLRPEGWSYLPFRVLFCHPPPNQSVTKSCLLFRHNLFQTWFSFKPDFQSPLCSHPSSSPHPLSHCRGVWLTLCPSFPSLFHQQPEGEKRSHLLFEVFRVLILGIKYKIFNIPTKSCIIWSRPPFSSLASHVIQLSSRLTSGLLLVVYFRTTSLSNFSSLGAGSGILYKSLPWEGHPYRHAT